MSQYPIPVVPTSSYELSQLEALARNFEREGHDQEAIFLRNLIRTLRKLQKEIGVASLRH